MPYGQVLVDKLVNSQSEEIELFGMSKIEERTLGVGASLYKGTGVSAQGNYVVVGDTVPAETTHLRVLLNGKPENVLMSPVASGVVSSLTETGATIGGAFVDFISAINGYKGEWYAGAPVEIGDIWGHQGSEWRSLTGADIEPVAGNDWRSLDNHANLANRDEDGAHPASAISFTPEYSVDDVLRSEIKIELSGVTASKTSPKEIYDKIIDGVNFAVPQRICSLDTLLSEVAKGNKFPVVAFGDSTYDGAGSTTDGTTPASVFNRDFLVSGAVPDGFDHDHDEAVVPNAWPSILQRMIRDYFSNTQFRLYNAGYRSQRLDNGWAGVNVHNAVYAHPVYQDAKMIFIGFGLNDNNANSNKNTLTTNFRNRLKALILDAYLRGVQPVLVTSVLTGRSTVTDGYNTQSVNNYTDTVKRELAKEMNLECIELAEFFSQYIQSNGDLITYTNLTSDELHQSDFGYLKQSEFLFKSILGEINVPDVSKMDGIGPSHPSSRLKVGYSNLSSGTTINRGVSQKYRNVLLNSGTLSSIGTADIYDLWVWCENPQTLVCYDAFINKRVNATLFDNIDEQLQLITSHTSYLVGTDEVSYTYPMPDFYGDGTNVFDALGMPTKMPLMKMVYGLNRLRLYNPSNKVAGMPANYYAGGFRFIKQAQELDSVSVVFAGASGGTEYYEYDSWCSFVKNRMFYSPGLNNVASPLDYTDRRGNRGSLPKVGSSTSIKVNAVWGDSAGVVLAYNLYDPLQVTDIDIDKNKNVIMGESLVVWKSTTGPQFRIDVRSAVVGTLQSISTNFDPTAYDNEDLIFELVRISSTDVAVRIKDGKDNLLYSTETLSENLTENRSLKLLSSFYIGGALFNSASAGDIRINDMAIRN